MNKCDQKFPALKGDNFLLERACLIPRGSKAINIVLYFLNFLNAKGKEISKDYIKMQA